MQNGNIFCFYLLSTNAHKYSQIQTISSKLICVYLWIIFTYFHSFASVSYILHREYTYYVNQINLKMQKYNLILE